MISGKVEIRKDFDNMLVMTGKEDGRLLKVNGTSAHTKNVAYLPHHSECIMPSSLLWHARFGHINYDNLCLLRKNGLSGLPTIPRKLKQCDACILGKHRKQRFHDSTSSSCRKLELIHYDFCVPILVHSQVNNISLYMISNQVIICVDVLSSIKESGILGQLDYKSIVN
jgi:hypothetical protein